MLLRRNEREKLKVAPQRKRIWRTRRLKRRLSLDRIVARQPNMPAFKERRLCKRLIMEVRSRAKATSKHLVIFSTEHLPGRLNQSSQNSQEGALWK